EFVSPRAPRLQMNVQIQIHRQLDCAARADIGNLDVTAPAAIVVGRHISCNVRLDSVEVSRQHARVILGPDSFIREALSSNGTAMSPGPVLRRARGAFPYGAHLEIGPFRVTVGTNRISVRPQAELARPRPHPGIPMVNAPGATTPSRGIATLPAT